MRRRHKYSHQMVSQIEQDSWASSPSTRKVMQANRRSDTGPELRYRRQLHALGIRFRVGVKVEPALRRTADVAIKSLRLAIFIDGCFWHGCPEHWSCPQTNEEFWSSKIAKNIRRDRETDQILRDKGWTVMRFWEHEEAGGAAQKTREWIRATRSKGKVPPPP